MASIADFDLALTTAGRRVESALDDLLPEIQGPEGKVIEAMRYSVFGKAKRFRPFLALESGKLFDVESAHMLRIAAAIECLHTYSLIHDDLPAMDNDPVRRGQPATHMAFDEATAILAGDALLTFAFELLSAEETHPDPWVRTKLVSCLAKAAGAKGMVGGQMIDIDAENAVTDEGTVTRLQRLKTGALIIFSCEAGAIAGHAREEGLLALNTYGHDLGLAFQITDDLLDARGDAQTVGKKTGKDAEAGKATFVSLLGIDGAEEQARRLADQAIAHLDHFDGRADLLRVAPEFILNRMH